MGIVCLLEITFYFSISLHSPQTLSSIFAWLQENDAEHKRKDLIFAEYITTNRSHLSPFKVAMPQICKFDKYQDENS